MFNIVLVCPRIAQNTGSIGRMCFNAGFTLHIIKPTIFSLDDKAVRRAGLDYWAKLRPVIWENLDEFLKGGFSFFWQRKFWLATAFNANARRTAHHHTDEKLWSQSKSRHKRGDNSL